MDEQQTALLLGHLTAAFNERDLSRLDLCIAPDYRHPDPARARGRQGMRDAVAGWLAAVDDVRLELDEVLYTGDKVVARMSFSGRQVGDMLGVPPTGRSFSVAVLDVFEVRDGMLAAHWDIMDRYGLREQLTAVPAAGR